MERSAIRGSFRGGMVHSRIVRCSIRATAGSNSLKSREFNRELEFVTILAIRDVNSRNNSILVMMKSGDRHGDVNGLPAAFFNVRANH